MIAIDSSIAIAAFASWHEGHSIAMSVMARRPLMPSHAALETISVLTRLPEGARASTADVVAFLNASFDQPLLTLNAAEYGAFLRVLPTLGLGGGAVYDALIAQTTLNAGATLVTGDHRAARTYSRVGVAYELVVGPS